LAKNIATCEWYYNIVHFLQKLEVPPGLSSSQACAIKLRSTKFYINKNLLYWKDPSRIFLRCLDKEQSLEFINQFHSSIYGGHHYWKTTAHKILRARYYWPTLFSDVFSFVKACDKCQNFAGRQQIKSLPLKTVHVNGPFQQWGLDFIGEINRHSSGQHKWILVATDYFTKWIEAIPTQNVEILNNMTHIHRDYPDYTLLQNTCIIHNLLYVDHQFTEAETITCAHRSINHTYQHSIFPGKASR